MQWTKIKDNKSRMKKWYVLILWILFVNWTDMQSFERQFKRMREYKKIEIISTERGRFNKLTALFKKSTEKSVQKFMKSFLNIRKGWKDILSISICVGFSNVLFIIFHIFRWKKRICLLVEYQKIGKFVVENYQFKWKIVGKFYKISYIQ